MNLTREPTQEVGLTFVDVLFALVAGKILDTATKTDQITGEGWWHLAVAAVLVLMSWVGYHTSRKRSTNIAFFNLPLLQFGIDVALVVLYWAAVVFVERTTPLAMQTSALPQALIIGLVFLLYVSWDLTAWRIRRPEPFDRRGVVSIVWFAISFLLVVLSAFVDRFFPRNSAWIVGLAAFSILFLIAYRVPEVVPFVV